MIYKTPWLYLFQDGDGPEEYCFQDGTPFACSNVVRELWYVSKRERIRFEVHETRQPEGYLVRLVKINKSPGFIIKVGGDWALANFHLACIHPLSDFYSKFGEKCFFLTCVGEEL